MTPAEWLAFAASATIEEHRRVADDAAMAGRRLVAAVRLERAAYVTTDAAGRTRAVVRK